MDKIIKPIKDQVVSTAIATVSTKPGLLGELITLFLIPILLVRFAPNIIHVRHLILLAGLGYVYLIYLVAGIKPKEMGLTWAGTTRAIRPLILPTLLTLTVSIFLLARYPHLLKIPVMTQEIASYSLALSLIGYITFSVPLQEFIFRAFYIPRLERINTNKYFLILYSAFIFMLVHVPFGNNYLLLLTGLMGIVWGDNFLRFRNLPAIMLSHSVLGAYMIYVLSTYS